MQWSAEEFAGFSNGTPWTAVGPGWESFNVADETGDPASILSHYRALIQARNQHSALQVGDLSLVATENDQLYSILRVSSEEAVLVLVNLSGEPVDDYALSLGASSLREGNYSPQLLIGNGTSAPLGTDNSGGFYQYVPLSEIPPYATFLIKYLWD